MRREFHARHDFQELVDFGYGHNCFLRLACGGCVEFSAIQSPPVRLQTPCWPRPGVARPPTGGLCAPPVSAFANQQFSSAKSCLYSTRTVAPRKGSLFLPMHLGRDFQAQAIRADEAGGVVLVVGLGRVGFHRGISVCWRGTRSGPLLLRLRSARSRRRQSFRCQWRGWAS